MRNRANGTRVNGDPTVCEPTARSGHILDLVMCDELDDDLVEVYVDPDYMAQNFHKLVNFRIKTVTSLPWPYRQMYSCIRQKGGRTSSKSPRR